MRTEGDDDVAAAVVVAAVVVADDEVVALAVEAAVPSAGYVYAAAAAAAAVAVAVASGIAGSSRYFSSFQENLLNDIEEILPCQFQEPASFGFLVGQIHFQLLVT